MSNHTMGYIALKQEQKRQEEKKRQESRDAENKLLMKRTTTKQTSIPDMREAYNKVVNSGYEPTEAVIHYERFTSGRIIDGAK